MTVTAVTPLSGPYNGNGATTVFAYSFLALDEADLVVTLTDVGGVETEQTLTTHYTVSGVGVAGGGNVTMLTAPATGEKLTITRAVTLEQQTDLQNLKSAAPEVLETAYDRLTLIAQDLQEQLGRAVQLPVSGGVSDIAFPTPSAGKVIGWNTAATALENKTPNSGALITLPAGSTDNAIVRFDGAGGAGFQNSVVTIDDAGAVAGVSDLTLAGAVTGVSDLTISGDLGVGELSPDKDLHVTAATNPTLRLENSGSGAKTDFLQATATFLFDIDAAGAVNNSAFAVDIDNGQRFFLDGDGAVLGTGTADRALRITGTDALKLPAGTTAQRPGTPEEGDIRKNSTTANFEVYVDGAWRVVLATDSTLATGDIFYVDASGKVVKLAAGTEGQVLKQGATVPEWGTSAGAFTLLGTLTTTSGSTQTLSGLDLTSYVYLYIIYDGVASSGGGAADLLLNGALVAALNPVTEVEERDLTIDAQVSHATTSISWTWSTGNFNAGTIKVYGVK